MTFKSSFYDVLLHLILPLLVTRHRRTNSTPVWRSRGKGHSQLCRLDVLGGALDGVAVLRGELGNELQQGGALVLHGLAVAAEQGLVLCRQHVDAGLQLGEAVPDVMHQQPDSRGGGTQNIFYKLFKNLC